MADATLSFENEEIVNPIETAVSSGASLVEPEKTSISRKRKVIVNSPTLKRLFGTGLKNFLDNISSVFVNS